MTVIFIIKDNDEKKFTKFESAFTYEQIESKLSGLTAMSAYSFTKRNNPTEFNNLLSFLPTGYVNKQQNNIELIDLIYSGSMTSPYLLTLAVGRNDTYREKEKLDIDVINIAPDTDATSSYFSKQWHHFKDENGNRVSYDIYPYQITDEETKKDLTYTTFLTGSTSYSNFEEYQSEKPDFFQLHKKSFESL